MKVEFLSVAIKYCVFHPDDQQFCAKNLDLIFWRNIWSWFFVQICWSFGLVYFANSWFLNQRNSTGYISSVAAYNLRNIGCINIQCLSTVHWGFQRSIDISGLHFLYSDCKSCTLFTIFCSILSIFAPTVWLFRCHSLPTSFPNSIHSLCFSPQFLFSKMSSYSVSTLAALLSPITGDDYGQPAGDHGRNFSVVIKIFTNRMERQIETNRMVLPHFAWARSMPIALRIARCINTPSPSRTALTSLPFVQLSFSRGWSATRSKTSFMEGMRCHSILWMCTPLACMRETFKRPCPLRLKCPPNRPLNVEPYRGTKF